MSVRATDGHPHIDVVIPGAQKSGTTTLIDLLGMHPSVTRHESSEYPALMNPDADLDALVREDFHDTRPEQVVAVKSAGVMHTPGAVDRIVAHNPDVRFLAMLRDPARRAFSAYLHARRVGDEPHPDFRTAWKLQNERPEREAARSFFLEYRRRSEYLAPLRQIRDCVGSDHLRVVTLEELHADQSGVLSEVLDWLGLEPFQQPPPPQRSNTAASARSGTVAHAIRGQGLPKRVLKKVLPPSARRSVFQLVDRANRRSSRPDTMSPECYAALSEEFAEHNDQLRDEFEVDTSFWTCR